MKNKITLFIIFLPLICLIFITKLHSNPYTPLQNRETAQCYGYIYTERKQPISNAIVKFIPFDSKNSIRTTRTDSRGYYNTNLPPGDYWFNVLHRHYSDYVSYPKYITLYKGKKAKIRDIYCYPTYVTTILLIRHAEKDGNNDAITEQGRDRAKKLCHVLQKAKVTAAYITDFVRTYQTAEYAIDEFDLETINYETFGEDLIDKIQLNNLGDTILVVGHSDSIDNLLDILVEPGFAEQSISIDEFDNMYIITKCFNNANVINLQYGASTNGDIIFNRDYIKTIFLVRSIPDCTSESNRPQDLKHILDKTILTHIFTDSSYQAEFTINPFYDSSTTELIPYDPSELEYIKNEIQYNSEYKSVLIVGDSITLNSLITIITSSPGPFIEPYEYDNLFIISPINFPFRKVVNLQYGKNIKTIIPKDYKDFFDFNMVDHYPVTKTKKRIK